jgi:KDO2-lipid IV(A) lauroyltransferase
VVEIIKGITISENELCRRVVIRDSSLIDICLENGDSSVVATAHCFNWEWALLRGSLHFPVETKVLYSSLSNGSFDKLLLKMRSRFGCKMIKNEDFARQVLRSKRELQLIALNADQVPQPRPNQFWIRFLNRDTAFIDILEKLPRILGYPVFFMKVSRVSRGYYDISFIKIASPPYPAGSHQVLEEYTRIVEDHIRKDPSNWLWSHRRWKHAKPQTPNLKTAFFVV